MKMEFQKIIAGYGLGKLKLGATREEILAILGEPGAVEEISYNDSDQDLAESWHYDKLDLSMTFDQEEDWRLITLAVTSDFYELEGLKLVGMSKSDLISTLEKLKIEDLDIEETEDGDIIFSSEDMGLDIWVEDNIVREVQVSVLFIDDDTIDWPK